MRIGSKWLRRKIESGGDDECCMAGPLVDERGEAMKKIEINVAYSSNNLDEVVAKGLPLVFMDSNDHFKDIAPVGTLMKMLPRSCSTSTREVVVSRAVRYTIVDMPQELVSRCGFDSASELFEYLRRMYPDLNFKTILCVVDWSLPAVSASHPFEQGLGLVVDDIVTERRRQLSLAIGGDTTKFDEGNSANDWIAYMAHYLGNSAGRMPGKKGDFRKNMVKVAALAVAAIQAFDAGYMDGDGEDHA